MQYNKNVWFFLSQEIYFRLGEGGKAGGWPFIQPLSYFRFKVRIRCKNTGYSMEVWGKLSITKDKGRKKQDLINTMKITPDR